MSKELIENLLIEFDEMGYEPTILCDTEREVESFRRRLKQVLDYLKAIENSKPSEALKEVENYIDSIIFAKDLINQKHQLLTNINIIKQALIKAQEQEKILSILKEKRIGLDLFYSFLKKELPYEVYFANYSTYGDGILSKEEFDLLKRWL